MESKTDFFRAVREGDVSSVSRPLRAGRSTFVVQTDPIDAGGGRVAQTTQIQAVIDKTEVRGSEDDGDRPERPFCEPSSLGGGRGPAPGFRRLLGAIRS